MQSIKVKVLTVFMSFVMAVSLLPALNSNAAVKPDSGNCGTNLSWYFDGNSTLTIKGYGAMQNFVYDTSKNYTDNPWYKYRTYIKKVVLPNGITSIGNYAFVWGSKISEIVWPTDGNLKTIGSYAFYECDGLTRIALPNGVTSVGAYAFAYCSYVTSISLPGSLKTIGKYGFAYTAVTSISLPSGLTTIGVEAFRGNYKLRSVTGGAGLKSLGTGAFAFTYDLRTFKITSKKLFRIGKQCFCCSGLKTLQIKKTTKLKKKKVKNSLSLSNVKTVKVKKSKVKKYRKFFTPRNCGKYRVKVKK